MKSYYHNEYIKCRNKYLELERLHNKKHDFYFTHGTSSVKSIISMIKDGAIHIGKKVKDREGLGGTTELEHVYTNIYFEDIHNLSHFRGISVVLHPKILHEYDAIFHRGWVGVPPSNNIFFNKNDTPMEFNKKLNEVNEFLKNPYTLPKIIQEAHGTYHHQVIFPNDIPLKDNLIGIVCHYCSKKDINKIKKTLKENSYKNVMILDRNFTFPSLNDFLEYIEKNN